MTPPDTAAPAPAGPARKEFTTRAVIASLVISAVVGASYPYIVLKLGFGPNVSVVAAFLGFLSLGLVFRDFSRWENNLIQSAGTAAGQTAFPRHCRDRQTRPGQSDRRKRPEEGATTRHTAPHGKKRT